MEKLIAGFKKAFERKDMFKKLLLAVVSYILFSIIILFGIFTMLGENRVTILEKLNAGADIDFNSFVLLNTVVGILVILAGYFLFGIIYYAYFFENAKAAYEVRSANFAFNLSSISASIVKALKLMLIELIYSTFHFLLVFGSFVVMVLITNSGDTGLQVVLSCMSLIVIVFVMCLVIVIHYLLAIPSLMRVVESNVFSNGLDIRNNFKFGKLNASKFLGIFVVDLVFLFGLGLLELLFRGVVDSLDDESIINIFGLLFNVVYIAIVLLFMFFARPYLIGTVYREARTE